MSDELEKVLEFRTQVESLKQTISRLTGKLDVIKDSLKKIYKCKDLDTAINLLDAEMKVQKKLEAQLQSKLHAFEKKWGDVLNELSDD